MTFIPPNSAVLADVNDINTHVGFWQPQPDFRIVERIDATPSTFASFPDFELEAIYEELVVEFVINQTRVGLRAMETHPDADLVMIYIEQPDGSAHQFLLTDPRQPTDFTDASSIGAGQDAAKVARYHNYVSAGYQAANDAVQTIIETVGVDSSGRPQSNVVVVSDHGFDAFHTAFNIAAFLTAGGFDSARVRAVISGAAVNFYINLEGREPNGIVSRAEYLVLQQQLVNAATNFQDTNPIYTLGAAGVPVFDQVHVRPVPLNINDPQFGRGTSEFIGQDSGDVFATLRIGYNFDGTQNPVVRRMGDPPTGTPILSVPNFYGAHGYGPELPEMSAIFYAAGPQIGQGTLAQVRNIDVAPTVLKLLDVPPAETMTGTALAVRRPQLLVSEIRARLAALPPAADRKIDHRTSKAIGSLDESLDGRYWIDDSHLGDKGGKAFDELKKAVSELMKSQRAGVADIIEDLGDAARELARIAIDQAVAAGVPGDDLDHSLGALASGEDELAGNVEKAISDFKKAWDSAEKALE